MTVWPGGKVTSYAAGRVPMLAEPQPVNLYGAWKLAGEHISRLFCEQTGVATLSLRPACSTVRAATPA